MADATAKNHELGIATTTSGHVATTLGPTDVCYDPKKTQTAPFDNYVATSKATEHSTEKTQIGGGFIIRHGDAIGPLSETDHKWSGGGITSGTYRQEARAENTSPDVKAEKKQVARMTDPTTQNHGNTKGAITDGTPAGMAAALEARKLRRCSLTELKATCTHSGRESIDGVLEVLRGDTVTLVATRVNAVEPGAAVCPPPPGSHSKTKFVVNRNGALPEKKDTKTGVDKYTLDAAGWIGAATPAPEATSPASPKVDPKLDKGGKPETKYERPDMKEAKTEKDPKTGKAPEDKGNAWKPQLGGKYEEKKTSPISPQEKIAYPNNEARTQSRIMRENNRTGATMTDAQKAEIAAAREKDAGLKEQRELARTRDARQAEYDQATKDRKRIAGAAERAVVRTVQSLDGLKSLFNGGEMATINVAAYACTGAKTLIVRSFTDEKLQVDLMAIGEILVAFNVIKSAVSTFENFCNLAGKDTLKVTWPGTVKMMLSFQFVELTRDSSANKRLKKNRCNRKWTLDVGFQPLIEASADFSISLFDLGGPAGRLGGWFLKKVADGRLGFKLTIKVSIVLTGSLDEYEENPTVSNITATIEFKPELYVQVTVGAKRERDGVVHSGPGAELKIAVVASFPLIFDSPKIEGGGVKFRLKGDKITFGYDGGVKVDVFGWWETEKSIKGTLGEYPFADKWFGPYPSP